MKMTSLRILFFSLLSILIYPASYAQSVGSFVKEGAEWNILESFLYNPNPDDPDGATVEYYTYRYVIEGDTIINSQQYKRLYAGIADDLEYYAAIREQNDTVIFLPWYYSTEGQLYDFTLVAGETWITSEMIGEKIEVIVETIDSVEFMDQTLRRRYNFMEIYSFQGQVEDTTRQLKWIEGVGSINFCTPWFPFCYHTGWNHSRGNLLCYHLNDTLLYQNEDYESCFYTTLSTKENNSEFEVSIYPNPSSGPFFIQFYQPTRQEGEVLLYDVNGALLSQHRFEKGISKIELSEQQNADLKQILVVIVMNNRPIQIQKLLLRS